MSRCGRCGTEFGCGMADAGGAPCWCTRLPALPRDAYADGGCLCPDCLRALIDEQEFRRSRATADGRNPP